MEEADHNFTGKGQREEVNDVILKWLDGVFTGANSLGGVWTTGDERWRLNGMERRRLTVESKM
jgi:hypothetical protein